MIGKFVKLGIFVFIVLLIYGIFQFSFFTPTDTVVPEENITDFEIVAEDLEIPWEIVFLPDGDFLVTERTGNLLRVENRETIKIEGVEHLGEGGLLGLALHPNFKNNNLLYLYLTTKTSDGLINRVERYTLTNMPSAAFLTDKEIILDNIPGASFHDGGRIAFGPDGYLYVTTGDAGQEDLAQDLDSLAGKILRLKDDGSVPEDNPFGTYVWSYGHRNPQGLAWDNENRLWSTEHGRSGIQSGMDELNLIESGKNYGWPVIEGDEVQEGMVNPVIHSGADETWAPADAVYFDDKIFFTGLRGESLYAYNVDTEKIVSYFRGEFGRLRGLEIHDNYLYLTTSNTDGRGRVREGDDKILRVKISEF